MPDIAPIHGLGAMIIFMGLLLLNSAFLTASIIFLLIEKRKKKRIIPSLNAKGLFISTLIVEIVLIALILFIQFSNNYPVLDFLDLISPVFVFTTIIAMIIINVKYSRAHKN